MLALHAFTRAGGSDGSTRMIGVGRADAKARLFQAFPQVLPAQAVRGRTGGRQRALLGLCGGDLDAATWQRAENAA